MLNLFPGRISAVSGTNTSVALVRYGYVRLVQVSGYHRFDVNGHRVRYQDLLWVNYQLADSFKQLFPCFWGVFSTPLQRHYGVMGVLDLIYKKSSKNCQKIQTMKINAHLISRLFPKKLISTLFLGEKKRTARENVGVQQNRNGGRDQRVI